MKRLVVIGIGQTLRGDDAAGIEAVRRWQDAFPGTADRADVAVRYVELPGLGLLDELDGFEAALLVDAVQSSGAPGTVYRLDPDDLASSGSGAGSAHGWGVAESLELGRQLNPLLLRVRIRLVDIEAQQIDLGSLMSPAIRKALVEASEAIEAEARTLLSEAVPA